MPSVRHEITISRPRDSVFAYLADFANDVSWRANVVEMRPRGVPDDLGGEWSQHVEVRKVPGRLVETQARVTRFMRPSLLAAGRTSGPVRPEARYELDDLGDGQTRLRFTLDVMLAGSAWLLWPLVALGLALIVRPALSADFARLKENLESPERADSKNASDRNRPRPREAQLNG